MSHPHTQQYYLQVNLTSPVIFSVEPQILTPLVSMWDIWHFMYYMSHRHIFKLWPKTVTDQSTITTCSHDDASWHLVLHNQQWIALSCIIIILRSTLMLRMKDYCTINILESIMFFSRNYNSHMMWNDLFTRGWVELCGSAPFCVTTGLTSGYSIDVTCGSLNYISLMQTPFMRREHE